MASVDAGGGSSSSQGVGRGLKRNLNSDLNLVPFIDLLSMCICFLLMTAVWTQMGALHIKQSHGTDAAVNSAQKTLDFELRFTNATSLEIKIKEGAKVAKTQNIQSDNLETSLKEMDALLSAYQNTDSQKAALVEPVQGVNYASLVRVIDHLKKNQIKNVGVIPVRTR